MAGLQNICSMNTAVKTYGRVMTIFYRTDEFLELVDIEVQLTKDVTFLKI